MAEPKTKKTTLSVSDFIAAVPDAGRRADAEAVLAMMARVTGETPALWGASIIGFGAYQSPTGAWPIVGFSPRKANLVLYIMAGFSSFDGLLAKLGKHKLGKSCLYLNRLADVDVSVLERLVRDSVTWMRKTHPEAPA